MFDENKRSKIMGSIRGNDTSIEVRLRKALWHKGVRYRKNYRVYDCRPDIVITKYKIAVFCDGDFWHGKTDCEKYIKTRSEFWQQKIARNRERDLDNTIALRDAGWIVIRFWESDINNDLESCVEAVLKVIRGENYGC